MTLLAMAIYDTEENKRTELTKRCVDSLLSQINPDKHDLYLIDNNSCEATKEFLKSIQHSIKELITLPENIGTARAINLAWQFKKSGENCLKMDNDVIINYIGWIEELEYAISIDPKIGILGLKRKDCWENPSHSNPEYKSTLQMISPLGTKWVIIEKVQHVIGTCQMYSSAFIDKMGYLFQPGLYGYDDVIASHKSLKCGFKNAFLPHIDIDHIDPGQTPYQGWKEKKASEVTQQVIDMVHKFWSDELPIYQEFY